MALVGWTGVSTTLSGKSPNQRVLGTATLRAALATTTSYVASSHVQVSQGHRVVLEFALTWADSTSTQWYVEWSPDGTTWFRSINVSSSGGVNTVTLNNATFASGASAAWVDPIEPEGLYMRVNVKKTGGVGADALAVTATLLGVD